MKDNYIELTYKLLQSRKGEAVLNTANGSDRYNLAYTNGLIEGYNEGLRFLKRLLEEEAPDPIMYENLRGKCDAFEWIRSCIIGGGKNE